MNLHDLPKSDNVDDSPDRSLVVSETSKSDIPKTESVLSVDENVGEPNVEGNKSKTDEAEEAEIATKQLATDENSIQVELSNWNENVDIRSKVKKMATMVHIKKANHWMIAQVLEGGQQLGNHNLHQQSASGYKGRPPIIASSFSFRCEERAAKHKEKLEEKLNAGGENMRLQAKSKEKADNFLKLRQSTGFIARPIPNSHRGIESPNNHMKKISIVVI
ncbi:hypothetical protein RHSIM_Rhsim12G0107400 [Rhododendron simsii]|uniref:TPX2 C-terminal domain-containing protein n=1 Tax=Rhododendron simsii TaxID=118357 RepID=A0A834G5D2_RHOSS|nr:hypothetical protein RHSIM_Rhsim12G0107400 [Rhododendron simsii]